MFTLTQPIAARGRQAVVGGSSISSPPSLYYCPDVLADSPSWGRITSTVSTGLSLSPPSCSASATCLHVGMLTDPQARIRRKRSACRCSSCRRILTSPSSRSSSDRRPPSPRHPGISPISLMRFSSSPLPPRSRVISELTRVRQSAAGDAARRSPQRLRNRVGPVARLQGPPRIHPRPSQLQRFFFFFSDALPVEL